MTCARIGAEAEPRTREALADWLKEHCHDDPWEPPMPPDARSPRRGAATPREETR